MTATISNIGLWYYRTFFNELHKPETPDYTGKAEEKDFAIWLKKRYELALKANWQNYAESSRIFQVTADTNSSFQLKTIYPGLVCGIGYEHELGFENEFKLGFSFDHTTGLPYIPGSSVKGTLRSAFKHIGYPRSIINDWINKENECPEKLKDSIEDLRKVLENTDWKKLEDHIFEGKPYSGDKPINSYKTDVFFDAFISDRPADKPFLADDYITCHQNRKDASLSPFTNPIPVRFLKVRSDVKFTFGFRLSDIDLGGGIFFKKEFKRELFKQILLDLGIGAKTNVGYGQFEEVKDLNTDSSKEEKAP